MIKCVNSFFKKITFLVGFIALIIITAIGIAGLRFKADAQKFYGEKLSIIQSSVTKVKDKIDKAPETIDNFARQANNFINQGLNTSLDVKNKIESIKNAFPTIRNSRDLQNIENLLSLITNILQEAKTKVDRIDPDEVNNFIKQAKPIVNQVQKTVNALPDSKTFGYYFGSTALGLTIGGGTVLGFYVFTSVLVFFLFKNVDGISVHRSKRHQVDDLTKHVKKILNKYPEVAQRI